MKDFMDKDFLLSNKTAQKLFHEAAAEEPIIDYHCHLIPKEIADNRRFSDIATTWLGEGGYGDHYKWRMLRANGVDEKLITGDADPYDRFLAWAETVPALIGNPLYHWTHLELQRYFGITEPLNKTSAPAIWKAANEKLQNDPDLSVYGIFKKFKVYAVGTTDDPSDTLEWHEKIAAAGQSPARVIPSFRPDKAVNIDKDGFTAYIASLAKTAGKSIDKLEDLLQVLGERIAFFDKLGARSSDHGLEFMPFALAKDGGAGASWEKEAGEAFTKALSGGKIDALAAESYKTFILNFLAEQYYSKGWAMQIHLSAIRNNNSRMFKTLGPDTGFDAVHDHPVAAKLALFLDLLESRGKLPKTIMYSLNFKDFYPMTSIIGSFQGGGIAGKMQLGSSWWYLDHIDGMEAQMKLLGNIGILSRFIGMLTDSRSFLSYPRHEYFRRILCNILGGWAENGEIPNDFELLSKMVKDISFGNAKRYFEI
ncbi:MAG: glucuronate isomerase [Treponema sp.]|jgi:glucuronate isomerase|nr:glucuronate isomerase [Treponema sp.]